MQKKVVFAAALVISSSLISGSVGYAAGFNSLLEKRKNVLEQRLKKNPNDISSHREYTLLLIRMGLQDDYERADNKLAKLENRPTIAEAKIQEKSEAEIAHLSQKEASKLNNMFAVAKAHEQEGNFEAAEGIYLQMLDKAPDLSRVKLDLALLYAKSGYHKESKVQFSEVMESDPPEVVKQNVKEVLVQVDEALEKHKFNASVMIGANFDTNGNAVSQSGNVIVNDIVVPLTSASNAQDDIQGIGFLSVGHTYNFDHDRESRFRRSWYSNAAVYVAQQRQLSQLDIGLVSFKTGPKITHKATGAQLGLSAGYAVVALNGDEYLNTLSGELTAALPVGQQWNVNSSFAYEHRDFINTLGNSTISQRTGSAYQLKSGASYSPKPNHVFNAALTYRNEFAKENKYSNDQLSFDGGYTYLFHTGISANLSGGYRVSDYDAVDPFISPTILRTDVESTGGLQFSSPLFDGIVGNLGYQYKTSDSTIENYEYSNHRILTSFSYSW